jgi:hypothetical protein
MHDRSILYYRIYFVTKTTLSCDPAREWVNCGKKPTDISDRAGTEVTFFFK